MAKAVKSSESEKSSSTCQEKKKKPSQKNLLNRNYSLYTHRVLREVVPNQGLSSKTADIMNRMINNILERIAEEACNLLCYKRHLTLSHQDLQMAVYRLLPNELAKHAVAFGTRAVTSYNDSKSPINL
ncbi:histone H2B subacrosomal variant-like [Antechinus flavipes]|uniref:histone H2B subacrosomal variant-like n=1 Tax=Antechinus flavipes TaxID=38775 RepID=UPI002235BBC8|nr:histone H2B subacrosomal variant-like [Antechinus flavipes]XP_051848374.1 histone H2B subacrosomal variant-like [Antechinus flavipes]